MGKWFQHTSSQVALCMFVAMYRGQDSAISNFGRIMGCVADITHTSTALATTVLNTITGLASTASSQCRPLPQLPFLLQLQLGGASTCVICKERMPRDVWWRMMVWSFGDSG